MLVYVVLILMSCYQIAAATAVAWWLGVFRGSGLFLHEIFVKGFWHVVKNKCRLFFINTVIILRANKWDRDEYFVP